MFPKESQTTYFIYGKKVVFDLWGPMPVDSLEGNCYYQLYNDMCTHEDRVNFLHKKSKAFDKYLKHEAWIKVQRGGIIKCLGSNPGGEYISGQFKDYLEKTRTVQHLTVHGSLQSNSAAKRGNRTHVERAWAMIFGAGSP